MIYAIFKTVTNLMKSTYFQLLNIYNTLCVYDAADHFSHYFCFE